MKVVVIGAGIAGLTAAINCDANGDEVDLFAKDNLRVSSSSWAQGGIAYRGESDSPEEFAKDIIKAGAGMSLVHAVENFVKGAPHYLKEFLIDQIKVPFQKEGDSEWLSLNEEAAHSKKRIIYSHDNTGEIIIDCLLDYIRKKTEVRIHENAMAVDLINIPHHSKDPLSVYQQVQTIGVYILMPDDADKSPKVKQFFADKIILATGGIGQIYQRTTNPKEATGDGIAMAYRAGARVVNMEFTQFHPTAMISEKKRVLLISEALRGEGATVVDHQGKDFLIAQDHRGALAPRDLVSRLIMIEQLKKRANHVYLRLPPQLRAKAKERFPNIYRRCMECGINIAEQDIPITPAFHFCCGGILTDMEGRTSLPNLFAVGETACSGIHGANRLASTSLLEGIFLAHKAANASIPPMQKYDKQEIKQWNAHPQKNALPQLTYHQKLSSLQLLMWNYVGVLRSKSNLTRAIREINHLSRSVEELYHHCQLDRSVLELRNLAMVAGLVADAAIKNPKSVGCHYFYDD